MEIVTMRELLECGVHFGHQTKRWNPRMKRYIFTSRNGIHVIDLQQTIKLIKKTYQIVKDIVENNGTILFVGTKKQAQEAIETEAKNCQMPFVNHRWLGGALTNNTTLRQSIVKLKKLERMVEDGTIDKLSGKESSRKKKRLVRLKYYLDGIKDMNKMPSVLFVVDTKREQLAVKEAHRMGIPIIGIVDTNADPTEVQYPIPANDDAIRAIKLICSIISKAVVDGNESALSALKDQENAAQEDSDVDELTLKSTKEKLAKETAIEENLQGDVGKFSKDKEKGAAAAPADVAAEKTVKSDNKNDKKPSVDEKASVSTAAAN